MNPSVQLQTLLSAAGEDAERRLTIFALLNLGIIESLANGLLSATDAVRLFYHAENCSYAHTDLKEKIANQIMGRGVQLPDLFDCLPTGEAQREFQRELASMRSLCLRLIEKERLVA